MPRRAREASTSRASTPAVHPRTSSHRSWITRTSDRVRSAACAGSSSHDPVDLRSPKVSGRLAGMLRIHRIRSRMNDSKAAVASARPRVATCSDTRASAKASASRTSTWSRSARATASSRATSRSCGTAAGSTGLATWIEFSSDSTVRPVSACRSRASRHSIACRAISSTVSSIAATRCRRSAASGRVSNCRRSRAPVARLSPEAWSRVRMASYSAAIATSRASRSWVFSRASSVRRVSRSSPVRRAASCSVSAANSWRIGWLRAARMRAARASSSARRASASRRWFRIVRHAAASYSSSATRRSARARREGSSCEAASSAAASA